MGISDLSRFCLKALPYKMFIKLYPKLKESRLSDITDGVFGERFFFSSSLVNRQNESFLDSSARNRYMLIQRGLWDYRVANFCFVKDMLANIIWCVERGYIPVVDIYPPEDTHYSERVNLWELFYCQPLSLTYKSNNNIETTKICPITTSLLRPGFDDVRNPEKIDFWHDMLDIFVVYNEKTQAYFDAEYKSLIKGKKVVACVLRSTDYTRTRPKGHPVQPSVDEVFDKLREVMYIYPIDYIYLATEDSKIADAFKLEFPNKVIENKRHYFNVKYDDNKLDVVSQVHFDRENDDYLKILEYMSSINLVSKCDYLVTGLSGGSEMAIYRNGNKYKYSYVFDKGNY